MIRLNTFLRKLRYKPKWIGNDFDGVRIVQFRDFKGFSPSIEYGTMELDECKQSFYFEILDLRNYEDGEIILPDSMRRRNVIYSYLNRKTIDHLAELVNIGLGKLYGGKLP